MLSYLDPDHIKHHIANLCAHSHPYSQHFQHLQHLQNIFIEIFPEIDSTHLALMKSLSCKDTPLPRVLLAEFQKAGIGQMQKKWCGSAAENLYFSYACALSKNLMQLEGLSLVIGLVVANILEEIGVDDVRVKWPNDVYCQGKKIAGILVNTELVNTEMDDAKINNAKTSDLRTIRTVISVGLNINMMPVNGNEARIDQPWTSLRLISGKIYDRNLIAASLIVELYKTLEAFKAHG